MNANFEKAIAWYVFIGGIIGLILMFVNVSFSYFLFSLFPAMFTLIIVLFFIASGAIYLRNPTGSLGRDLIRISLILQFLQFDIAGFYFKNYFGIYAGLGISMHEGVKALVDFKPLYCLFANGYRRSSSDFLILVNLFPVAIFIALYLLESKSAKQTAATE